MLVLRRHRPFALVCLFCLITAPLSAGAHEFWIQPLQSRVAAGEEIVAHMRLGQDFKGDIYPFVPQRSNGAWVVDADGTRPAGARLGDIPAFTETAGPPGLHILAYHSTASRLSYKEPGKFAAFLEAEGLQWALADHQARGLSETGFDEAFSRCAKALVQSGDGDGDGGGSDTVIGMPIELVADANPYTLPAGATDLPVRLLWQDAPMADAQIKIFRKNGALEVTTVRTGPDGGALIPLGDGGRFLLSAVQIIPWDELPKDAWHSYWASLTFEIKPAE